MRTTVNAWLWLACEYTLAYLWLLRGIEGAGNVLTVMIWIVAMVSLFALSDKAIKDRSTKRPALSHSVQTFLVTWLAVALVWHGHIATGIAAIMGLVFNAVSWQQANEMAKEARR